MRILPEMKPLRNCLIAMVVSGFLTLGLSTCAIIWQSKPFIYAWFVSILVFIVIQVCIDRVASKCYCSKKHLSEGQEKSEIKM